MNIVIDAPPETLQVLGSTNKEIPNLQFRLGTIGTGDRGATVWKADFAEWAYTNVAQLPPPLYLSATPQSNLALKEEHMEASDRVRQSTARGDGLLQTAMIRRVVPLVAFIILGFILAVMRDVTPFTAAGLLIAQLILLAIGIRAWIPRTTN